MTGENELGTAIMALMVLGAMSLLGPALARSEDRNWLPMMLTLGYVAKLVGAFARFWVLMFLYGGIGDARGYHGSGLRLNDVWRSLQIPDAELGTEFVDVLTGFLYVPYEPTFLGGFFLFATLAFLGQIMFYAAFRHAAPPHLWKWFGVAIFFYPTLVYWPSSIGKEAIMIFFMGIATYGVARLLKDFNPLWLLVMAVGLGGGAAVRPHISLLIIAALVPTLIICRSGVRSRFAQRLVALGATALLLGGLLLLASTDLAVNLESIDSEESLDAEIDALATRVSDRTDSGGSSVEGGLPQNPAQIPGAILKVLFRPLPYEAGNIQMLASSFEGTLLLALVVWRLPALLRFLPKMRRTPFALFCLLYTLGFSIAFSAISNLGVLARQRAQVVPFLLAVLVLTGQEGKKEVQEPLVASREPSLLAAP